MSDFDKRLQGSRKLEQRVIDGLHRRDWLAYPFGQEQIPEDGREVLKAYLDEARRPSMLRWMPDILAVHSGPPVRVVLIDAKGGNGQRYAIETRSVEVAEMFVARLHTPVFFVCEDGRVLSPRDVRERGFLGPATANGSGTPYLLVEKRWATRFDVIFGAVAAEQATEDRAA